MRKKRKLTDLTLLGEDDIFDACITTKSTFFESKDIYTAILYEEEIDLCTIATWEILLATCSWYATFVRSCWPNALINR